MLLWAVRDKLCATWPQGNMDCRYENETLALS
jgi:hypothetical protein